MRKTAFSCCVDVVALFFSFANSMDLTHLCFSAELGKMVSLACLLFYSLFRRLGPWGRLRIRFFVFDNVNGIRTCFFRQMFFVMLICVSTLSLRFFFRFAQKFNFPPFFFYIKRQARCNLLWGRCLWGKRKSCILAPWCECSQFSGVFINEFLLDQWYDGVQLPPSLFRHQRQSTVKQSYSTFWLLFGPNWVHAGRTWLFTFPYM